MMLLRIITSLVLLAATSLVRADSHQQAYTFGVFPYLNSSALQQLYVPVIKSLETELGHKVTLVTEDTHKLFIRNLYNEQYDIVLVPPFWYPVAVDKRHYIPLLKVSEPFVSRIMVLYDSEIDNVRQLIGKTIATPPKFAPVVSLITEHLMLQGIVPGRDFTYQANENVSECFQRLVLKQAEACVSPPYAIAYFEKQMNIKLRTIQMSRGIPSVAVLVNSKVVKKDRTKIISILRGWSNTEHGKQLLGRISTEGFVPVVDEEYDVVRKILKTSKHFH